MPFAAGQLKVVGVVAAELLGDAPTEDDDTGDVLNLLDALLGAELLVAEVPLFKILLLALDAALELGV